MFLSNAIPSHDGWIPRVSRYESGELTWRWEGRPVPNLRSARRIAMLKEKEVEAVWEIERAA